MSVIDQLLNRRSIRNFTGERVKDADLELILRAAQRAPTSMNGQQTSLVVVRERATIEKIAEIAGGQRQVATADVFIAVVIDYNRTAAACRQAGAEQVIEQSAEAIVAGSVDAGIVLNALQTAANALGYGSTAIGGIRRDPQAMIELLKLPARTYPVVGATIGVPDPACLPQLKPRVPLESFALRETYSSEQVAAPLAAYDVTLREWWDAQGQTEMPTYSQVVGQAYSKIYYPTVAKTLRAQGFEFADKLNED